MLRGVLLDLDGVIYSAGRPIPGAAAAVRQLRQQGLPLLFVTNTTSRTRSALVRKLAGFGIPATPGQILTPAVAAAAWMRARADGLAALFVPEALKPDFEGLDAGAGAAAARYVVIGDLGRQWTFDALNQAFRLLHADPGRKLVALGRTPFWRGPDGLDLDVGAFVAALEFAAMRTATVMGKPSQAFYLEAARILGARPGELLMVGDDLRVDGQGASQAGLLAALVKTGKFGTADLDGLDWRPDWILESVRDLPRVVEADRQH